MRAIAYYQGRPFLAYDISRLEKLIEDIKIVYGDLLEQSDILIFDDDMLMLRRIPTTPLNREQNSNLFADSQDVDLRSIDVYIDEYGNIVGVFP